MYKVYWLIKEDYSATYLGFSNDLKRRVKEHRDGKVKTTKSFGIFRIFLLEQVETLERAREREKYWKSSIGRKKLKNYFNKIKNKKN